jgi:hypothetical protein
MPYELDNTIHSLREVVFSQAPARYLPGAHSLPPAVVGAGYQSLGMKVTKVNWPKPVADLFVGHLDISDDGGRTWRRIATWRDDGSDVCDPVTGAVLDHSFLRLFLSAQREKPVYTHEGTWVRGAFECKMPITTAITIEGN